MVRVRTIRPTRRGIAASAVVAVALGLVATVGSRGLGAVALPGGVAVAAGAIQLARAAPPTVTRSAPEPGFPGERRDIAVSVESALPCTVIESLGDGLAGPTGEEAVTAVLGHGGSFEYAVEYERRGEHEIGPARCRLTDSLGLFRASVEAEGSATVLVYPRVYGLRPGTLAEFGGRDRGRHRGRGGDRSAFDRLRRFAPSDSVRDIHWRASAKRPDGEFLVSEYEGEAGRSAVTVVGEATPDGADEMASIVGSIALHLLDDGVAVTVSVPGGDRLVRPGEARRALELLATTGAGSGGTKKGESDIHVRGGDGTATVRVADRSLDFDTITDAPRRPGVLG